ncbi:MAG: serine protease [Acidimicrobiales bacterium]
MRAGLAEPSGPVRLVAASSPSSGWEAAPGSWQASVVRVRTARCRDEISGSGVIVDGRVLTNVHVVDGGAEVVVTTHDGTDHRVRRMEVSARVDLAVLTVDGLATDGGGLDLAAGDQPDTRTDEGLRMGGFPEGGAFTQRSVSVTGLLHGWAFPDPARAFHLDAAVVGGESGSPIVDGRGRLAGLLYARALVDGRGLAIGTKDLREASASLAAKSLTTC